MKSVEELEFTDDFMFGTVMQDEKICKGVLERLLHTKISRIEYPKLQDSITPFYTSKGVRLDVYVEDGNRVFDVEMQCRNIDSIEKRVRYYQSMIDVDNLSKGADYSELKETYVIFICKNDPFSFGCPRYEVKSYLEGDNGKRKIEEAYNDNSHKLFFNARAYEDEKDDDLKAFLHYVCKNEATDNFTKELEGMIMELKTRENFKSDYFSWSLHDRDIRMEGKLEGLKQGKLEGLKQGKLEGLKQGKLEIAKTLLAMNLPLEQIVTATGLSIQEINNLSVE